MKLSIGKIIVKLKVVFMCGGKEATERYFIDEFGRLWKALSVEREEMSMFWIFAGVNSSGACLWVLQSRSGSEKLTNYEHEEITADQAERVQQMYLPGGMTG